MHKPTTLLRGPWQRRPLFIAALTSLLTAFALVRTLVFIDSYGAIEHDGGWMLTISESLALRGTYTTMVANLPDPSTRSGIDEDQKYNVQDAEGRIWFFTGNGVGPASIIPDALVLKLFGVNFWTLHAGPLLFYTLFLILAALILYRLAGLGALILFHGYIFFYPSLSFFLAYDAMGEVPTMVYVLLAYLVFDQIARGPSQGPGGYFLAGLVSGLVLTAKFIGLLSVGGLGIIAFGMAVAVNHEKGGRGVWHTLRKPLAFGAGLITLPLIWEVIQCITLVGVAGFNAYLRHLNQRIGFLAEDGSGIGAQIHSGIGFMLDKLFVLSEIAHPSRLVTGIVIAAVFAGGLLLLWHWRAQPAKWVLLAALWLGWLANTIWFVAMAKTGWVRHDWFGLILATMILSVLTASLVEGAVGALRNQTRAITITVSGSGVREQRGGALALIALSLAGLALTGLILWGFLSQPFAGSILLPDEIVMYWQQKQLHDKYGASLPWMVMPRAAQDEIVQFIQNLPPNAHVYFPGGYKSAEIPPLTGRINYTLARRTAMGSNADDVLLIGPSLISNWLPYAIKKANLDVVRQTCQTPILANDFYMLCAFDAKQANGQPIYTPLRIDFVNGISLVGYHARQTVLRRGDSLQVTLYWQTTRTGLPAYKGFVHLLGATWNPTSNNPLWGQRDQIPGSGAAPTDTWSAGTLIADPYLFRVDKNAPLGKYQIEVGMYLSANGERLALSSGKDSTVLYEVEVVPQ